MKKICSVIVVLSLITVLFAGCGKKTDSGEADTGTKTEANVGKASNGEIPNFKLGFSVWGTSDSHGRYVAQAAEWCEALGGEVVVDIGGMTPEGQIASAENLIQAGCNAITFCAYTGESIIPKISQLCKENEVYFAIWDTTVEDDSIREMLDANPYFAGTTNEDQEEAGYTAVKQLADKGASNFVLIKYAIGVATCDMREEGALRAIDELGLNCVYTIVAPEDTKKAVQDVLTSYPTVDAIVSLGATSAYITPSIQAIEAVGRKGEVLTAGFDFSDTMGSEIEAGDLSLVFGGHIITSHFANLMALDALFGTPINEERKELIIPYLLVKSTEDIDNYNKYVIGDKPYTVEEMKEYLKYCNPDLTFDKFQEMVSKYSIEDVVKRHE